MIRRFKTEHTVPSQGYLIYEKNNENVYDPVVAFTGDTTIGFLFLEENKSIINDVLRAPVLIMEMTYIENDKKDRKDKLSLATERGHMHLDHFVKEISRFKNEQIVLIHFSAAYSAEVIRETLRTKLPPSHQNIVKPLLVGF